MELWTHLRLLFCRAVWHLRCRRVADGQQVFSAAAVVALTAAWIERAVRLDWLRVSTDLAGASTTLPSWCTIHKRFDLSQEAFAQRWCLGTVLAHVSTNAVGAQTLSVHVPAVLSDAVGPVESPCCLLVFLEPGFGAPLAVCATFLCYGGPAVCPLCWLPRRPVYVIRVRILDYKKNNRDKPVAYSHQMELPVTATTSCKNQTFRLLHSGTGDSAYSSHRQ